MPSLDDVWALGLSEEEKSSNSSGSDDGGGQATAAGARKRKATAATAETQSGTYETSTYRGVSFLNGRWEARINVSGQLKYLGRFDSEEAAARAYDRAAKDIRDSPVLNFLPDGSLNPDRKKRARSAGPPLPDPGRPSTYRGVCFNDGRWKARISINGQMEQLGIFDSEEAAARAYDRAAKELRDFPTLNFLSDGSVNPDRKRQRLSGLPPLPDPGRPSIYRGVSFLNGRWVAKIRIDGQSKHLGVFDSEEAAARAYDERAKAARVSPVLNFLSDGSVNPDRKKQGRPAGQRAASATAAAEDEHTVAIEEEKAEHETSNGSNRQRPSIYRGVIFDQGQWVAQIKVRGEKEYLGRFDSEKAAARAYDERAKELRKSAVLNFLPDGSLNPERKKRSPMSAGPQTVADLLFVI